MAATRGPWGSQTEVPCRDSGLKSRSGGHILAQASEQGRSGKCYSLSEIKWTSNTSRWSGLGPGRPCL